MALLSLSAAPWLVYRT